MSTNKKKLDLTTLATIPFIMVLGNSMLIPILPQIEEELQITQFQVSLIITMFSISAALMIPFSGYLSDRFGRKIVMMPSLFIFGLGGIIAGYASWKMQPGSAYYTMLAARALQGIGAAGTAPITMALVGDIFKKGAQSTALGIIEATNGLGKVASPIVGTLIALIAWYAPFFAFPILCILAIIGLFFFVHEPKTQKKPIQISKYVRSIVEVFKKDGRWLIASFFVGSIGLYVLFGLLFYLSDILELEFNIVGLNKGYVLAIPLLGMVGTAFITGRVIKKNFKLMKILIITGLLCMAGSLIPMIFIEGLIFLCVFLVLTGVGIGLAIPCINSFITGSVNKAKRGMITSLYSGVRFGAVALGPPIFGFLMDRQKWILFSSHSALLFLTVLWALWAIRVQQKGGNRGNQGKKYTAEHNQHRRWQRVHL